MMPQPMSNWIKRQQLAQSILWAAMVFSVLVYAAIPYLMQLQGNLEGIANQREQLTQTLELIFIVLTPICILGSLLLGRVLLSQRRILRLLSQEKTPEQLASRKGQVDTAVADQLRSVDPQQLRWGNLVGPYLTTMMLRLAVAEIVAIVSLIMAIVFADPARTIVGAGISLFLMVLAFPRLGTFIEKQQREQIYSGH